MSETSSGNPLESTVDHAPPTVTAAISPHAPGYVLYERVGIGGMGEVYRCGDDALHRDLAIKVIKSELLGNADAEERFLREARLTGSLQHPGIVPIHQLGRLADGRPYYTMKLIRGRTFADMIRDEPEGPERLPRLLAVVEKVCLAVAYAHSRGVIHRDLKPNNVMVGEFGEVQVMDWGLAKELSRIETLAPVEAAEIVETVVRAEDAAGLSRAGAALGTPNYMSPEQAAGDWEIVDERTDVFALGAILCQVLTGRPPYYGASQEDILRRARLGDLAEALQRVTQGGADAALEQLCRECLAPQREDRPRNAAVVSERLSAYEAAVQERLRQAELERVAAEVRAREEQARAAAERRAKRRLLGLAAAVLIFVLVGAAGLAIGMILLRKEQRHTLDALDQVTAEQTKTQAAWKQTRQALTTLTDDIMEELLGKQAVLGEKEKAFLRKALGFYERFAAERGEGEEARAVAAEGQLRVARLRAFLGETAAAEEGYRAAAHWYEQLAGDFPAEPLYRQHQAGSLNNLAVLLRDLGRRSEAERVYRQAQTLREKLVGDFPDMPQYRRDLAGHLNNLGSLLTDLGKRTEAETAFRQARRLHDRLVGDFPTVPEYRRELASSHYNLAVLLALRGKREEAEAAHREALTLLDKLANDFPAVPEFRHALATSHTGLGMLLNDLHRGAEAESAYRTARALLDNLVKGFPAVPGYRQDLARSHNSLANVWRTQGKGAEAEKGYRQARTLLGKLVADFPAVPQYRLELAGNLGNFAEMIRDRGQPQAALAWFDKVIALIEPIVAQDARLVVARRYLRSAHAGRALALVQLGRHADSARDWQRAAEFDDGRLRPYYRLQYAVALARTGEHRTAVTTVEELLKPATSRTTALNLNELLYDSACVYALSAAAVKNDGKLHERYAVRAIALLRQARNAGLFKDPKMIEIMRKDTDLDVLRQRDDFKKFLAELK